MPITPVKTLVEQAKAEITTLGADTAQQMAEQGAALLVDIRDVRELDRDGRIPGAFHAPRGMLEFWVDPESPYHKPVFATDQTLILFCAAASRSALAAKTLQDIGVGNVAEMDGGFKGWKEDGRPVE
ncbi:MAG: rhodanese-like domain-containing protein [Paracoccaceae bacterium]|nr:rhodanese-like domain-containing protein [Paracoccaceae bacterium]